MVLFPEPLKPVNQRVAPFWPRSSPRSSCLEFCGGVSRAGVDRQSRLFVARAGGRARTGIRGVAGARRKWSRGRARDSD